MGQVRIPGKFFNLSKRKKSFDRKVFLTNTIYQEILPGIPSLPLFKEKGWDRLDNSPFLWDMLGHKFLTCQKKNFSLDRKGHKFAVDSNDQAQLTKLTTVICDVLNVLCLYQKDLRRVNSFGSLFCIHV